MNMFFNSPFDILPPPPLTLPPNSLLFLFAVTFFFPLYSSDTNFTTLPFFS